MPQPRPPEPQPRGDQNEVLPQIQERSRHEPYIIMARRYIAGKCRQLLSTRPTMVYNSRKPASNGSSDIRTCIMEGIGSYPFIMVLFGLLFVVAPVVIGVVLAPPRITALFDDQEVPSKTIQNHTAFRAALQSRLPGGPLYKSFDIIIAYELGNKHALNHNRLMDIADFEGRLRSLPEWQSLCNKTEPTASVFCTHGLSFANIAFPTQDLSPSSTSVVPPSLIFDGQGSQMLPAQSIIEWMQRYDLSSILLPEDTHASLHDSLDSLSIFRSVFRFKRRCCAVTDTDASKAAAFANMQQEWSEFLEDTLVPFLRKPLSSDDSESRSPLRVWFTFSDGDAEVEVEAEVQEDIKLAIAGALPLFFVYVLLSTRSIIASLFGICCIILGPLLAYSVFAIIGDRDMNVVVVTCCFPCMGLGIGALLLYTYAWQEAVAACDTWSERISRTWDTARCVAFPSAATSACIFLGTVASSSSLRYIGVYLGLMLSFQWVVITFFFVPLLAVEEQLKYLKMLRLPAGCMYACASDLTCRRRLGDSWAVMVYRRRFLFSPCIFIIAIALGIGGIMNCDVDENGPQIFHAEHNQNRGKQALALFTAPSIAFPEDFPAFPTRTAVCDELRLDLTSCSFMWCDTVVNPRTPFQKCECSRQTMPTFNAVDNCAAGSGGSINVLQRFVGFSPYHLENGGSDSSTGGGMHLPFMPSTAVLASPTMQRATPLVHQEWETGKVYLEHVTDVSGVIAGSSTGACGWRDMCYCGHGLCRNRSPQWWVVNTTQAAVTARDDFQWLAEEQSENQRRPRVYIVLGVIPNYDADTDNDDGDDTSLRPVWRFSEEFNPSDLWAQRRLLAICEDITEELRIAKSSCWLQDFKAWMIARGGRYPVPATDFTSLVMEFTQTVGIISQDFLWIVNGEIKGWYAEFEVDVPLNATADEVGVLRAHWDGYIASHDQHEVKDAWHTSSLWLKAEMPQAESSGNIISMVIVSVLVLLAAAVSTCNVALTVSILLTAVVSVAGVIFAIGVLFKDPLGYVETVALITLLAHGLSHSIQISLVYKFSGGKLDESRKHTVAVALLGSTIATAGASVFLALGCLPVFRTMGCLVIIGILLAAIASMIFLPATIEILQPSGIKLEASKSAAAGEAGASQHSHGACIGGLDLEADEDTRCDAMRFAANTDLPPSSLAQIPEEGPPLQARQPPKRGLQTL